MRQELRRLSKSERELRAAFSSPDVDHRVVRMIGHLRRRLGQVLLHEVDELEQRDATLRDAVLVSQVLQSDDKRFHGYTFYVILSLIFFHFPSTPLSSCQFFLSSHFCTNWLSRLGLGEQLGSTTDHLQLLLTQHTKRSKYDEGRVDRVVVNRGCWNSFWYAQSTLELGNHTDGACEYGIEQRDRKVCGQHFT